MKIVFEQPVVNVVELATGPKGDSGPPSTIPGPPNTLTAGTITQIPAGGQPTVSITGTAPNQTLNLGLVDGSPTAFELRGEGFPGTGSNATATNAASPGTYYTDTLGTNGAWRWLKVSAGTGTARWTVVFGDTGGRAIMTWDAAGVISGTNIMSGMAPTSGVSGGIYVHRRGGIVTLRLVGVTYNATSPYLSGLPAGFNLVVSKSSYAMSVGPSVIRTIFRPGYTYIGGTPSPQVSPLSTVDFPTIDPWPSTLPGTPA